VQWRRQPYQPLARCHPTTQHNQPHCSLNACHLLRPPVTASGSRNGVTITSCTNLSPSTLKPISAATSRTKALAHLMLAVTRCTHLLLHLACAVVSPNHATRSASLLTHHMSRAARTCHCISLVQQCLHHQMHTLVPQQQSNHPLLQPAALQPHLLLHWACAGVSQAVQAACHTPRNNATRCATPLTQQVQTHHMS
jgi:hypothetical protein